MHSYSFREPQNSDYIYSIGSNLHIRLPLIDGQGISTDNTCKTLVSIQHFFSSIQAHITSYQIKLEYDYLLASVAGLNALQAEKAAKRAQLSEYSKLINILRQYEKKNLFNALLSIPQSNAVWCQLRPQVQDHVSYVIDPLFSLHRGQARSALSEHLRALNFQVHIQEPKHFPDKRFLLDIQNKFQALPPEAQNFQHIKDLFQEQLKLNFDDKTAVIDGFEYMNGCIKTYIDTYIFLNHSEDNLLDYLPVISNLCLSPSYFYSYTPVFYRSIINHDGQIDADTLSIISQFFLAHVNIYCYFEQKLRSRLDFGLTLDANKELCLILADTIQVAMSQSLDVEQAIIHFINQHADVFGLNTQIDSDELEQIRLFYTHNYNTISATKENQHHDDFIVCYSNPSLANPVFKNQNGLIFTDIAYAIDKFNIPCQLNGHALIEDFNSALNDHEQLPIEIIVDEELHYLFDAQHLDHNSIIFLYQILLIPNPSKPLLDIFDLLFKLKINAIIKLSKLEKQTLLEQLLKLIEHTPSHQDRYLELLPLWHEEDKQFATIFLAIVKTQKIHILIPLMPRADIIELIDPNLILGLSCGAMAQDCFKFLEAQSIYPNRHAFIRYCLQKRIQDSSAAKVIHQLLNFQCYTVIDILFDKENIEQYRHYLITKQNAYTCFSNIFKDFLYPGEKNLYILNVLSEKIFELNHKKIFQDLSMFFYFIDPGLVPERLKYQPAPNLEDVILFLLTNQHVSSMIANPLLKYVQQHPHLEACCLLDAKKISKFHFLTELETHILWAADKQLQQTPKTFLNHLNSYQDLGLCLFRKLYPLKQKSKINARLLKQKVEHFLTALADIDHLNSESYLTQFWINYAKLLYLEHPNIHIEQKLQHDSLIKALFNLGENATLNWLFDNLDTTLLNINEHLLCNIFQFKNKSNQYSSPNIEELLVSILKHPYSDEFFTQVFHRIGLFSDTVLIVKLIHKIQLQMHTEDEASYEQALAAFFRIGSQGPRQQELFIQTYTLYSNTYSLLGLIIHLFKEKPLFQDLLIRQCQYVLSLEPTVIMANFFDEHAQILAYIIYQQQHNLFLKIIEHCIELKQEGMLIHMFKKYRIIDAMSLHPMMFIRLLRFLQNIQRPDLMKDILLQNSALEPNIFSELTCLKNPELFDEILAISKNIPLLADEYPKLLSPAAAYKAIQYNNPYTLKRIFQELPNLQASFLVDCLENSIHYDHHLLCLNLIKEQLEQRHIKLPELFMHLKQLDPIHLFLAMHSAIYKSHCEPFIQKAADVLKLYQQEHSICVINNFNAQAKHRFYLFSLNHHPDYTHQFIQMFFNLLLRTSNKLNQLISCLNLSQMQNLCALSEKQYHFLNYIYPPLAISFYEKILYMSCTRNREALLTHIQQRPSQKKQIYQIYQEKIQAFSDEQITSIQQKLLASEHISSISKFSYFFASHKSLSTHYQNSLMKKLNSKESLILIEECVQSGPK